MSTTAKPHPRRIELLAPARNAEIGIEAILHGADAVYIGASSHGARASAGNSIDDIERLANFAHRYGARVYATVNTLVYDSEIAQVERLVGNLYRAGVDALIVQDLGLLRMSLPPIALHASTQCDIRTPEKAEFLSRLGFSQLVVPRELTLDETAEIASRVDISIEAFVHGALCVSYSGDCQAGFATMGRSANRGECPQICRLPYTLIDGSGREIMVGRHLLSLKDLNRIDWLEAMLEAGVSSFKIEGRLKDAGYVKTTVAAYRRRLDEIIARHPERYCRASDGYETIGFAPRLDEAFNRGFTSYFTGSARPAEPMASIYSPKWCGLKVGTVTGSRAGAITAHLTATLSNGDGLGYFDDKHQFQGFRLNRVEGNRLFPAKPITLPVGTALYRNLNKQLDDTLRGATATRKIDVDITLRTTGFGVAIDVADSTGRRCTIAREMELQPANKPQEGTRETILRKSGGTEFNVVTVNDLTGNTFIAASALTALRRDALDRLSRLRIATHRFDYRRSEDREAPIFTSSPLTYHDNVANQLAHSVYTDHGASIAEMAMEVEGDKDFHSKRVMTTRYCLRRELGCCLREKSAGKIKEPLTLKADGFELEIKFDCRRCGMDIYRK